jgi:hypothetical protein
MIPPALPITRPSTSSGIRKRIGVVTPTTASPVEPSKESEPETEEWIRIGADANTVGEVFFEAQRPWQ